MPDSPLSFDFDSRMLDRAARAALRATGRTQPNPVVGCVLTDPAGNILATARHDRFGGPHAEANAIRIARQRGHDTRGATAYVTLEPCNHHGKQPPCTDALIDAGVARVVIATRDPFPEAAGGIEHLRAAGINAELNSSSQLANAVSEPFIHRVTTGLPWLIAKWAQTIDGKLATRTGDSKWISSERSRRDVHRLRARADAIITGIGTAAADNPTLTARNVHRRTTARRVLLDPRLELSPTCNLATTAADAPLTVITTQSALNAHPDRAAALARLDIDIATAPATHDGRIDLHVALRFLAAERNVATAMLEAGPRLLAAAITAGLANELRVYIAPVITADAQAMTPDAPAPPLTIAAARRFKLVHSKRFDDDIRLIYRAPTPTNP